MAKATEQELKDAALESLRGIVKPGDRLYTILRHVSQSGMSRIISVVKAEADGTITDLDWLIARAGLYTRTGANSRQSGLRVRGVGMDMGFAVVYDLSSAVLGDGYALKQAWL